MSNSNKNSIEELRTKLKTISDLEKTVAPKGVSMIVRGQEDPMNMAEPNLRDAIVAADAVIGALKRAKEYMDDLQETRLKKTFKVSKALLINKLMRSAGIRENRGTNFWLVSYHGSLSCCRTKEELEIQVKQFVEWLLEEKVNENN